MQLWSFTVLARSETTGNSCCSLNGLKGRRSIQPHFCNVLARENPGFCARENPPILRSCSGIGILTWMYLRPVLTPGYLDNGHTWAEVSIERWILCQYRRWPSRHQPRQHNAKVYKGLSFSRLYLAIVSLSPWYSNQDNAWRAGDLAGESIDEITFISILPFLFVPSSAMR